MLREDILIFAKEKYNLTADPRYLKYTVEQLASTGAMLPSKYLSSDCYVVGPRKNAWKKMVSKEALSLLDKILKDKHVVRLFMEGQSKRELLKAADQMDQQTPAARVPSSGPINVSKTPINTEVIPLDNEGEEDEDLEFVSLIK